MLGKQYRPTYRALEFLSDGFPDALAGYLGNVVERVNDRRLPNPDIEGNNNEGIDILLYREEAGELYATIGQLLEDTTDMFVVFGSKEAFLLVRDLAQLAYDLHEDVGAIDS